MTKYITLGQGWQRTFREDFFKATGLKAKPMGYTNSSTTLYTWMVRTKKTKREVQDLVWDKLGAGWVDVQENDPREVKDRYAFG
jgi:hypothetical protein